ncbi:glycosyltransferase [Geodermatophilus sp. SYSU D00696]
MATRVSVCMPASRPSQFFLEALDSVLSQSIGDLEIIITDDSGGDLEPLVRSRQDPRIRYLPNSERLGLSGNHCRALDHATGEVIAFLHDDDVWAPGYLSAALEILASDDRIGLVLVDMAEMDASGRPMGRRRSGMAVGLQADPLSAFLRREFVALIPSASVFRRAALDDNKRPWPDVVAGDLTMYVDCVLGGWRVYHLAEPLVRYRIHEGQTSMNWIPLQTAVITVFSAYSFLDPAHERQRVHRVAGSLVARAAGHLRVGAPSEARTDLRRARGLRRRERWVLATGLHLLSYLPLPVFRAADRTLRGARDCLARVRQRRGACVQGRYGGTSVEPVDGSP